MNDAPQPEDFLGDRLNVKFHKVKCSDDYKKVESDADTIAIADFYAYFYKSPINFILYMEQVHANIMQNKKLARDIESKINSRWKHVYDDNYYSYEFEQTGEKIVFDSHVYLDFSLGGDGTENMLYVCLRVPDAIENNSNIHYRKIFMEIVIRAIKNLDKNSNTRRKGAALLEPGRDMNGSIHIDDWPTFLHYLHQELILDTCYFVIHHIDVIFYYCLNGGVIKLDKFQSYLTSHIDLEYVRTSKSLLVKHIHLGLVFTPLDDELILFALDLLNVVFPGHRDQKVLFYNPYFITGAGYFSNILSTTRIGLIDVFYVHCYITLAHIVRGGKKWRTYSIGLSCLCGPRSVADYMHCRPTLADYIKQMAEPGARKLAAINEFYDLITTKGANFRIELGIPIPDECFIENSSFSIPPIQKRSQEIVSILLNNEALVRVTNFKEHCESTVKPLIDLCNNVMTNAPARTSEDIHRCLNSEHLIDYWLEGNTRFIDTNKLNHALPNNHRLGDYHLKCQRSHMYGIYPFNVNISRYMDRSITASDLNLMRLGLKNAKHVIEICVEMYNFVKDTEDIGKDWTNAKRLGELYAYWVHKRKLHVEKNAPEKLRARSVFNLIDNQKYKRTRNPEDYTSDLDIVHTLLEPYTSFGVMALLHCGGQRVIDEDELRGIVSQFRIFPAALACLSYKAAKTPEYWIKVYPATYIVKNIRQLHHSRALGRAGRMGNLRQGMRQQSSGQNNQRQPREPAMANQENNGQEVYIAPQPILVSEPFPVQRDPVEPVQIADLPNYVMNDDNFEEEQVEEVVVEEQNTQDDFNQQHVEQQVPRKVDNVFCDDYKNEEDDGHFAKEIIIRNQACAVPNLTQEQVDALVIYSTHIDYRQIRKTKDHMRI